MPPVAPTAETTFGRVQATHADGCDRYLGIPFATAERFRRPVPPSPWPGTREAGQFGPSPMQPPPGYASLPNEVAEDCLTANVWTPSLRTDTLPVVVWIYGGGFENGTSAMPGFDGARLATAGRVVVITVNYRLGMLGWARLAHHGGRLEEASNLGLQDQVAALEWVHANCAAFGGDPARITVVGESAGAFCAAALLAVPRARALVSATALFSGAAARVASRSHAERFANLLLAATPCARPDDLVDVDPRALFAAQAAVVPADLGPRNAADPMSFTVVDDSDLPDSILSSHPARAIERGDVAHLRLLVSSARDEIAAFRRADPEPYRLPDIEALAADATVWGIEESAAARLAARFAARAESLDDAREGMLTDWVYRLPAARTALAHARSGGAVHLALANRVDGEPALHACDVRGVFAADQNGPLNSREQATFQAVTLLAHGEELPWARLGGLGGDPIAQSLGDPLDATALYRQTLTDWEGVPRP